MVHHKLQTNNTFAEKYIKITVEFWYKVIRTEEYELALK